MRVLITGGTGLIGTAFSALLIEQGDEVWVLSRNPDRVKVPEGVKVEKWDGKTSAGWQYLMEEMDVVVNLAGENLGSGRWTVERKRNILQSRILAGQAVCEAFQAAKNKPRVLLQASAIGIYGTLDDRPVTEEMPPGSDYLSQVAVAWEAVTQPVEALGVRRVVLRTGLVLTPDGGALQQLLLPFKLFVGGPLGSGKQWWSWISLADQISAMRFLMYSEKAVGPVNIASPSPVTMNEFGKVLGRVMYRPYWLRVPAFALKLLLGEMSILVLEGQRVIPSRLLEWGYEFKFPRLDDALENLF